MNAQVDHLVVAARTLQEGVAWCEATLGITPGAGGEHPLFGTHNRLFRIATVNYPRAYFEIIAINPGAPRAIKSPAKCWFDLDSSELQDTIKRSPRLVHFVANTSDVNTACASLKAQGIDRGPSVQASRMTAAGLLQWQITVREDGQRLFNGGLPTLIEWGDVHPANGMPDSGVSLINLRMATTQVTELQSAYQAIGLQGVQIETGEANLIATLQTPKGLVTLESKGL
ncbi:VOC family protein [Variovorax sp. PCZ-1]|uniref:VOC family protein n=1 Tax=Variovorax sp. PCZ-1 TaxID=2835533 RepID=UPI001BCE2188|nr:VOC family protein [Variovorax sp. PCZ-1]MBS7806009.1 VOC family protein [Variovorax sp. PCZ-1]